MQVVKIPDFLVDATNVYRTREYIVRQEIVLRDEDEDGVVYECKVKPARESDKNMLQMLLR